MKVNQWYGRKFSQWIEIRLRNKFGDEWFLENPPSNFLILQEYSQRLRYECSEIEYSITNRIRKLGIPVAHQVIFFNRYIADIALPGARTIIEIDGGYHSHPDQKKRDVIRDSVFHTFGFDVHRWSTSFSQDEWNTKIECFVKAYKRHKSDRELKPLTRPVSIEKITPNGWIQKSLALKGKK